MAEWMTCPGCQLRHSRRADGVCPRCKQPVDAAAAPTYSPPEVTPLASPVAAYPAAPSPSAARLGNLAQAARGNQLKSARGIMLFIGVASFLVNAYFLTAARSNVEAEISKELGKMGSNFVVDPDKLAEVKAQAIRTTQLMAAGGMLLGAIFVACGMMVEKHPVPITIAALSLYLGGNAIFGLMNPASLGAGIFLKVFIVIALFKAVQAAIAYQKELTAAVEA
jgi:hypothetical protein